MNITTPNQLYINILKKTFFQTLLSNKGSKQFLDRQLNSTGWTSEDISRFLAKETAEDQDESRTAYTWRKALNETDRVVLTMSRFMEVG